MSLFHNKYRVESTRLRSWDYSSSAAYFVTLCTFNKEQYFGAITNEEMYWSCLGIVANDCWLAIPQHFPFVDLDVFTVMPNHVHGIIGINRTFDNQKEQSGNSFGPKSKNLGSIMRGYKIGVTNYAKENSIVFSWQPRFHDHIIRNEEEYLKIGNYIITNPKKWREDTFYRK